DFPSHSRTTKTTTSTGSQFQLSMLPPAKNLQTNFLYPPEIPWAQPAHAVPPASRLSRFSRRESLPRQTPATVLRATESYPRRRLEQPERLFPLPLSFLQGRSPASTCVNAAPSASEKPKYRQRVASLRPPPRDLRHLPSAVNE